MKKKIFLLTLLATLSTTKGPCEEWQEGYFIDEGIDYSACYSEAAGCCYYDSRHIACYAIALAVGVAVVAGVVAIVINQNHCSHAH